MIKHKEKHKRGNISGLEYTVRARVSISRTYKTMICSSENGLEEVRRVLRMEGLKIIEGVREQHRPVCVGVSVLKLTHNDEG